MGNKKTNYIELFIDKAAIAIAGLIAVIIIFVFVIGSPKIEYAGGKYGPSEIDDVINKKAARLKEQLKSEPNEDKQYKSEQKEYLALLNNSIKDVNSTINFPLPGYQTAAITDTKFVFQVPAVGKIEKPSAAVVRMAAFVPTEELSPALSYASVDTRLEDMDLVTIESSIDVKTLYSQFREAFASRSMPLEKRKEQYAKPVFAKVQLQRKTQQSDGNWSDWADVPLTKVCYLKKNLSIPEQPSEYTTEMSLVQFAKGEFRNEVLQPSVYCNAIPSEPWMSPSFYNQRQKTLAKEQDEIRRLEVEAEKAKRSTPSPRETKTPARTSAAPGRSSRPPATDRKPVERQPRPDKPVKQVESAGTSEAGNFNAVKLKPDTNLESLEKLVFWAHDDTTKPGEKYQYRIRIGVFNPIAARDWFNDQQKELRDKTVLWSDFADLSEVIEIPQRLYFFATDYRENVKTSGVDKTVEVVVVKYMLGNWVSKKYNVKCGEQIGKLEETPDARLESAGITTGPLDFSTGAVMVDTRRGTEWYGTGILKSRDYDELLYSLNGKDIERMLIKERFWPAKITKIYKEITSAIEAQPVVLLDWDQASSGNNTFKQSPTRESSPSGGESQPSMQQ